MTPAAGPVGPAPRDDGDHGGDVVRGDDARAAIAARQAALVAALVTGAPAPAGLDRDRVDAAARALLRKRTAEVAHHWPALLEAADARAAFREWAADRPRGGSHADGLAFAEHLQSAGRLHPAAAAELAAARRRLHPARLHPARLRRVATWLAEWRPVPRHSPAQVATRPGKERAH